VDLRGEFLPVARSALCQPVNDQAGIRRKRNEPDVRHGEFGQPKAGYILDHLLLAGGAVGVDEDGVIRQRIGERCQISDLERIQPGAFLGDNLFLQRLRWLGLLGRAEANR